MALYNDAKVRLKNKNAETTDYDEIRQIRVPSASGGVAIFPYIESMVCYYVKPTGSTGYYEVLSQSLSFGGKNGYALCNVNTIAIEDERYSYELSSGGRAVAQVLTTKRLTVGQTYHTSEF